MLALAPGRFQRRGATRTGESGPSYFAPPRYSFDIEFARLAPTYNSFVPELPDVTLYVEALTTRVVGKPMTSLSLKSPFVLRSVTPPVDALKGLAVRGVRRVGKRIVLVFDDELFLVIHLMIAGRLRWREPGQKVGFGGKMLLASFTFPNGTLFFTEASSKKRASIELVQGDAALDRLNPGGVEPLEATLERFAAALTKENHPLKRALTDPHLFSGIGNA